MRIVPFFIALLAAIVLIRATPEDRIAKARAFYRSQPRYLQPILGEPKVVNLPHVRADNCGTCHAEIYAEWKASTHARAWKDDAQFQEELKKHVGGDGKNDASWMCVNCHTPFEAQLERLVVGLEGGHLGKPQYVDNPNFDARLQEEAITCATCHVRDGVIVGPYGNTIAPHPVKKADFLVTSEICLGCHQANAKLDQVELACVFDTGLEHAATEGAKTGETCQSCHMPEIERSVANVPVTPKRKSRRHFFGGSLIPKKEEFRKDVERMRPFYKDGMTAEWVDPPQAIAKGKETSIRFAVKNENSGHMLPTGDPERFIQIDLEAKSADGKVLASHREVLGSKYEWNPVKKISDTRLARGERREFEFKFTPEVSGKVVVSLRASKWRIGQENFDYHKLAGRYVAGVPFLDLVHEVSVTAP